MEHKYFSDRELGSKERSSEEISDNVWNGIISIYHQFITNNALAANFSAKCSDGQVICGCNQSQLEDALKAEIPELETPINRIYDFDDLPNKYYILDLIEFIHSNIKDPCDLGYHSYYKHNHYSFNDNGVYKSQFRKKINTIFSRNGIVFFIDEDGVVKRSIPQSISRIITDIRFNTEDERLNELLEIAYSKFVLPRIEIRIESLEKIWDAFERLKTYYEENKRLSSEKLVDLVSENNSLFSEFINDEFKALTQIGNSFQIRHFEQGKVKLDSNLHIDFLFYRMSCLIHLCLESMKNNK